MSTNTDFFQKFAMLSGVLSKKDVSDKTKYDKSPAGNVNRSDCFAWPGFLMKKRPYKTQSPPLMQSYSYMYAIICFTSSKYVSVSRLWRPSLMYSWISGFDVMVDKNFWKTKNDSYRWTDFSPVSNLQSCALRVGIAGNGVSRRGFRSIPRLPDESHNEDSGFNSNPKTLIFWGFFTDITTNMVSKLQMYRCGRQGLLPPVSLGVIGGPLSRQQRRRRRDSTRPQLRRTTA